MQKMTVDVVMVDGTEHKGVQVILADQVGYSTARQRHKWAPMEDDPLMAGAFMGYLAMKRQGLFTGSWDEFTLAVAAISADDDEEDTTVDPI